MFIKKTNKKFTKNSCTLLYKSAAGVLKYFTYIIISLLPEVAKNDEVRAEV